jgi:hypothetical protein
VNTVNTDARAPQPRRRGAVHVCATLRGAVRRPLAVSCAGVLNASIIKCARANSKLVSQTPGPHAMIPITCSSLSELVCLCMPLHLNGRLRRDLSTESSRAAEEEVIAICTLHRESSRGSNKGLIKCRFVHVCATNLLPTLPSHVPLASDVQEVPTINHLWGWAHFCHCPEELY